MPTIEIESDIFLTYRGINIYHVYKDDDKENGLIRDYQYSFSEYARQVDDGGSFFVDELPQWKPNAEPSYSNGNKFYEAVKKTIREAIDACELDEQIEAGGQEIPERYINHYIHLDCPNAIDGDSPEWTDRSAFTNNDKCECGAEIEPWKSEDIEPETVEVDNFRQVNGHQVVAPTGYAFVDDGEVREGDRCYNVETELFDPPLGNLYKQPLVPVNPITVKQMYAVVRPINPEIDNEDISNSLSMADHIGYSLRDHLLQRGFGKEAVEKVVTPYLDAVHFAEAVVGSKAANSDPDVKPMTEAEVLASEVKNAT